MNSGANLDGELTRTAVPQVGLERPWVHHGLVASTVLCPRGSSELTVQVRARDPAARCLDVYSQGDVRFEDSGAGFLRVPGRVGYMVPRGRLDSKRLCWALPLILMVGLLLSGCKGLPTQEEKVARENVKTVGEAYRPQDQRPVLPLLKTNSALDEFLLFAMLNQPQVEAAYFDWLASVERITQGRSLPDPVLTFQSDIADTILTLMPGLMQELPGPGKLGARAQVASAESQARYHLFESRVLQTAFDLKRAYYRLYFLEEKIRINRETLDLLGTLEKLARTQNEVGKVTLQDVLRAQIEQERLATELTNLLDSRNPLLAQLKAALGLISEQADPPTPNRFETTSLDLTSENLFEIALARNPRLKALEADVRRAEAAIQLARKARVPDFSLGLMADVKASPTVFRPLASVSLPLWRDKIAAELAEAQAGRRSAEARLSSEQIALAVDFAENTFSFREVSRNLGLLQDRLIPKARLSLEVARAGYLSGQIDFFNLIDAERTYLGFQLEEVEQRTQRELVLANLSFIVLGQPPANAPLLGGPASGDSPRATAKETQSEP